jgi:hypothetical protein
MSSENDDDDTRVVRFLGTDSTSALAAFQAPATDAHRALYAVHDGRLAHLVSAENDDAFGERMIALGKSYRRSWISRLLRRGRQ